MGRLPGGGVREGFLAAAAHKDFRKYLQPRREKNFGEFFDLARWKARGTRRVPRQRVLSAAEPAGDPSPPNGPWRASRSVKSLEVTRL